MIHIYTGDGKGKTTAALGLALRAAGHGMKTQVISFLKDGASGEALLGETVPSICVSCFQTTVQGFFWQLSEPERIKVKTETQKGFLRGMQCAKNQLCDILILDEIAGCLTNGLLDVKDVLAFLHTYGNALEIVLTGCSFPPSVLACADYVSEIVAKKHPYENGAMPRKGIEY